jgi:hypothetical protein
MLSLTRENYNGYVRIPTVIASDTAVNGTKYLLLVLFCYIFYIYLFILSVICTIRFQLFKDLWRSFDNCTYPASNVFDLITQSNIA